jgi:hypothetical protein
MASRTSSRTASVQPKASAPSKAPAQVKPPDATPSKLSLAAPGWSRWLLAGLAAFLLISVFTSESGDSDTWWHLKTGEYIVQQHKLPVPDPFSWTSYMRPEAYPGEATTRYFNLTHEWLSQVMMYSAFATGGFTGLILLRALWLTGFCAILFLIIYRRTGSYYPALAGALAAVCVLRNFVADRPQYVTYVFLAITILILESRKRLWVLPPLLLIWANCHAGFIMGWVVMGAYCGESLYYRLRGKPVEDERRLWIMCVGAILISGLNPNVYNVIPVLRYYRESRLQSSIWEWQRPKYWEISPFTILMYSSAALLLINFRKTRPVDWMLFGVFSVSGLMAMRNIFLTGLWGPILIATYLPRLGERKTNVLGWIVAVGLGAASAYYLSFLFSTLIVLAMIAAVCLVAWRYEMVAAGLIGLLLTAGISFNIATKNGFQFRGALWKYPEAATDFLLQHHIKGRIFNTYGQGGYLIWKLWPHMQVFLDGRALNESVYWDGNRMGMNADSNGGKSGEELLKEYGVDIIIMDGFDSVGGTAYYLPAALADPSQKEWKLVFQDVHDVIYMRNPPPDVTPLKSIDALGAMEEQCVFFVQHGSPLCSRGMIDIFGRIGDRDRYNKWREVYKAFSGAANAYEVRPK